MRVITKLKIANKKKPVLFTGAGISYYSGLPLANEIKFKIVDNLITHIDIKEISSKRIELHDKVKSLMLEGILELFSKQVPKITPKFSKVFLNAKPTDYHFTIAYLLISQKVNTVITTNFDDLIEQAFDILTHKLKSKIKLNIVYDEKKSRIANTPTLIKIHGCAKHPHTLIFNLRQVGIGLDEWKIRLLKKLSSDPFIFIGYSDQDKDLSPILDTLKNEWYWLVHNYIPLKEQIPQKSGLFKLLNSPKRVVVFCDAKSEFLNFANKTFEVDCKFDISYSKFDWKKKLLSILQQVNNAKKISVCGDLLYDLLGEVSLAECVYKKGIRDDSISIIDKLSYETKLNVLYGNNWDIEKLEKRLKHVELKYKDIKIPRLVSATLHSQWATLYYRKSISFSKLSEKHFVDEENICDSLGMTERKYHSIINQAVILQRRGDFVKSENKYLDCIPKIKKLGNIILLSKSIINYSSLLIERNKVNLAIRNLKEALALLTNLGEEIWTARLIYNIGLAYKVKGQSKLARENFEECKTIFEKYNDSYWVDNVKQALREL